MNNAKPTPGPWGIHARKYSGDALRIVPLDQAQRPWGFSFVEENENRNKYAQVICTVDRHFDFVTHDELQANARLIAAAPELLEACNSICEAMAFAPKEHLAAALDRSYNLCRAAVAKAEGPPMPDRSAEPNTPEAK